MAEGLVMPLVYFWEFVLVVGCLRLFWWLSYQYENFSCNRLL